ncbi:Pvc16 family protein [Micromonospora cathayae]|uniref:Pvc16 family protein n=1 Tax=Micromonospora cathayae TaxID=3028804 RepID=A0ABY7ZVS7_9ACTN|nr:Pvc16 family protein [Micromonospora sp. HUAS 3]WDZ87015.1 Pvc16 family protein [Micromonospora sp. HUAS 3]
MIWDVDLSVRAWLGSYLPAGVPVVFDPPDRCAQRTGELVSAFLLDVEEDATGVSATWDEFRDDRGQVTGRRPPGRRYRFSYLLTAWGPDTEREHRLLGDLLVGCASCTALPVRFHTGALARANQAVLVRSAPRRDGDTGSAWVAYGGAARTGLHLQLLVPFVPETQTDLAPAPREVSVNSAGRPGGDPGDRAGGGPRPARHRPGRISEPG